MTTEPAPPTSLRERAEALAAWWHRELTEYGHCTHTSTEKACEAWAAAFIATGPTLAVSPESADEGRGDELPRLIEVPSEEAMYALLCGLNYGEMPELACTWKGLAFVATLTDPDADYVNYIHADESGLSRCPTSCDNCGTADRIDDPWKPTYPVVALLAVVPNAERAAQDGTDTWWTTATSPARPAESAPSGAGWPPDGTVYSPPPGPAWVPAPRAPSGDGLDELETFIDSLPYWTDAANGTRRMADFDLDGFVADVKRILAASRPSPEPVSDDGLAALRALADEWDAKGDALWDKWPGGHAPRSQLLAAGHHLHATELRAALAAPAGDGEDRG